MTKRSLQKFGIVCGLMAILFFIVMYLIAMSLDTGYVFGKNYLSDLGVSEGAWAFNSGLIVAGLLFVPFSVLGVRSSLGGGRTSLVGTTLLVIAALFLVSIGVFTEDSGDIHGIVSYGFFLTMLVALGVLAYALYRSKALGMTGFVITLAAFVFGLGMLPLGGTPLSETLAVLAILVWGTAIGILLLLSRPSG